MDVKTSFLLNTLLLLLAVLETLHGSSVMRDKESKEYCHTETFNATCPADHVILMHTARYGRMQVGRCLDTAYFVGCYANVLPFMDAQCSGKPKCTVKILDSGLLTFQPCRKDLMAYLEASFLCIPVPRIQSSHSCASNGHSQVQESHGHLLFGTEGLAGSFTCPWRIKVNPGQKIHFTAFDFRTWGGYRSQTPKTSGCKQTLHFLEDSLQDEVELCSGGDRVTDIYMTASNSVDVYLEHHFPDEREYNFLLSFRAVGCADIQPSGDMWIRRTEKTAVVTCNHTKETWHLVCRDDTWIGELRNCSAGSKYSVTTKLESRPYKFHYGILIAIALGLVLGILLGTIMLICMMSYRRKRRQQLRLQKQHPLLGEHVIMEDKYHVRSGNCSIKDNMSIEGTLTSELEEEHKRQMANGSQELLSTDECPDVIYSPHLPPVHLRCTSNCVACNGPAALSGSAFIYGRVGRPEELPSASKYRTQNIEMTNMPPAAVPPPKDSTTRNTLASV